MRLSRQLLTAQLKGCDHLLGQVTTFFKAKSVEADLSNQTIVWNHHGHGSKKGSQVVRQLGSTGVARIHGDENVERWLHGDQGRVKLQLTGIVVGLQRLFGSEELQQLLRNHTQHFDVDAIELVKATPSTT